MKTLNLQKIIPGLLFLMTLGMLVGLQACGRALNTSSGGIYDISGNDSDLDGSPNTLDNCPDIYNPNQADINFDGQGDACTYADELTAPVLSLVEQDNPSQLILAWTNNNAFVSGYTLKRKINDNDYAVLAQLDADQHSYQDNNIQTETDYTYVVEVHAGTEHKTSNFVSLTMSSSGAVEALPTMPSNVSIDFINVDGECRARFNWYDNSNNETLFFLFSSVNIYTNFTILMDDIWIEKPVSSQEASGTGLRQHIMMGQFSILDGYNNDIYLEIMACNDDGCSDMSPRVHIQNGGC